MRILTEFVRTDLVTPDEVREFVELFSADRKIVPLRWARRGTQAGNYDALVTSPQFDTVIRHPLILQAVEELMGGAVCFGEIGIRFMGPYDGELKQSWHRDKLLARASLSHGLHPAHALPCRC